MEIRVVLERGIDDGGYLAWVVDLPGCSVRAPTRDEVVEKVPGAVTSFVTMLAERGVPADDLPGGDGLGVRVVDEVETPGAMAEADTDVLLDADRAPLTPGDWARLGRWSDAARAQLLAVLADLEDDALDHHPDGAPRSVREVLLHLGIVELFYAAWTFDLDSTDGVRDFLRWTRDAVGRRMADLAADGDERVTAARWSGAERPEEWSARKAARRLIWHDLLHTRGLRRQLERA